MQTKGGTLCDIIPKMQKKLTENDISKIKKTNLFRFSDEWYSTANFVTIFSYGYSFFMPYYGWRRKPEHIPENLTEYIQAVIKIQCFYLPLLILVLSNIIVKRIEIKKNYKTEKSSVVVFKRKISKKKRFIIFKPFHLFFFSNTFKYNDVEEGSQVKIEKTALGRILNYEPSVK